MSWIRVISVGDREKWIHHIFSKQYKIDDKYVYSINYVPGVALNIIRYLFI